ncbi:MAG TPA: efflux RND transporter periplasmic adaptor subunit [Gemmatimonadaceae bacterium]
MLSFRRFSLVLRTLALCALAALAACGDDSAGAQGPGAGGMPPAAVQIVTVAPREIPDASELLATIRSLHSTTVQPEVDGTIRRIFVKAGDHVKAGAPLVQIDPDKQQAAVHSLESNRAGREADVKYWRQQVDRLQALLQAGAISRQEFEQAQNQLRTAEAALASLDAQVREGRVELRYYRVTAPTSGIVGDIPVREGDRVTTSTMITTIDDKAGLEAYIQVPIDRAPSLREGLPVELLDADGKVIGTNTITFVAPRVDDATQTVLAKSLLRDAPASLRVQQFVRVRIIWRTVQAITVPVVAVLRVSGQYFCFVAEPKENGLVAQQRPVELGDVVENSYVVRSGLKAGDRLIVSGIQKIGDGAPVRAES